MMWAGPGGPVTDDFAKQSLKEDCLVWSSLPLWAATSSLGNSDLLCDDGKNLF